MATTTTTTSYQEVYGPNKTSMSDADYYGRSAALGVDIEACRRAAVAEARRGAGQIINGHVRLGVAVIRRAVIRLSIVLGNQSYAEEYLSLSDLPRVPLASEEDHAELLRGSEREYAHPGLASQLAEWDAKYKAEVR